MKMLMREGRYIVVAVGLWIVAAGSGWSAETDQYLTWDVELEDSADAVNEFLNETAREFVQKRNEWVPKTCSCEAFTIDFYNYMRQGMVNARIKSFLNNSPKVDRYPPEDVSNGEYYDESIYNHRSFPFIMPMAYTVNLNGVYVGVDKLGHFFGFGRRYFHRFQEYREEGLSEEEAMEKVVLWGKTMERGFTGLLVNSIFSHADMEANFQGFRMARTLCMSDNPVFVMNSDCKWEQVHEIDIRPYMHPDMDESYNTSHYGWSLFRKDDTLEFVKEHYCDLLSHPVVKKRFEYYQTFEPSFSKKVLDRFFAEGDEDPRRAQSLEELCSDYQGSSDDHAMQRNK